MPSSDEPADRCEGADSILRQAIPEFPPDPEDERDGLNYSVFDDLSLWAVGLNLHQEGSAVQRVLRFYEEAANSDDPLVIDVIRDALYVFGIHPDAKAYKSWMGTTCRRLLRQALQL